MASNQRQDLRLVQAIALRLVWVVFFVFLVFECWVLTMGRLQTDVVCVERVLRERERRPSSTLYLWAVTM